MPAFERNAIISVFDKTDLVPFMTALAEDDWQLFATSGSQDAYNQATGSVVNSLGDLIGQEGGESKAESRENVAQQISGLMLVKKCVHLACVNLRPPLLESNVLGRTPVINLDVGGMSMIGAAENSGALVVTQPSQYGQVLEQMRNVSVDLPFRLQMQRNANQHIVDHLTAANSFKF